MHRLCIFAGVLAGLTPGAAVRAAPVLSDDFATREWHMSDGLPNEQIGRVNQDRHGYLWVATVSGMVRFDGAHFEEYPLMTDGPAYSRRAGVDRERRRGDALSRR